MNFSLRWMRGVFAHRAVRMLGSMIGVAVTIALLASLGTFLARSSATMTSRAIADIPIDWQIQLSTHAAEAHVRAELQKATPVEAAKSVWYADVGGFTSRSGGTVQTTSAGKAVGLPPDYLATYPRMMRKLTGSTAGVLLAQQTAANLHASVGDTVIVKRIGQPSVSLTVKGVVSFPYADTFFQAIGVPAGSAPQAPPDNVLILPLSVWHTLFDSQQAARPDTVKEQLHVRVDHHTLAANPAAAYTEVVRRAHNFEARISGSAIVADNLAARLSAVRADAVYARVLFLFLGFPGAVLAMLLTIAVANSGRERREREQALLRTRGATAARILRFESLEAISVAAGGVLLGWVLTLSIEKLMAASARSITNENLGSLAAASLIGIIVALGAVLYPAWRTLRLETVASSRRHSRHATAPLWRRLYLDMWLLAIAGFVYWRTAASGYQVVLAPEGVPQISVHYSSFIAPFFLWLGGVLLAVRLWETYLDKGRRSIARAIRPSAGAVSDTIAAMLSRQRVLLTRGVVLVALAISFAVSTSIFNTSYNAQSRVDAELTNGADVTVTGTTSAPASRFIGGIRSLPGVAVAEPMMHRFSYVGHDLQDIYGINPGTIGEATHMSDAFFANGNAKKTLALLSAQPNGILVSEETRRDYQLNVGDLVKLRMQFASDHQYHVVPFRFVGVVREFPTAPKDSFLVANADYIAHQTGMTAEEVVLIRSSGIMKPTALAKTVRTMVRTLPGARVTDLASTQRLISSSLTSVDLHGLTTIELVFALLLVVGSAGLVLALGMNERRRNLVVLRALGARPRHIRAFVWSEALLVLAGGLFLGTLLGFGVAQVLVNVLKHVFDPPPEHLIIPFVYLGAVLATAIVSTIGAASVIDGFARRSIVEELRGL